MVYVVVLTIFYIDNFFLRKCLLDNINIWKNNPLAQMEKEMFLVEVRYRNFYCQFLLPIQLNVDVFG